MRAWGILCFFASQALAQTLPVHIEESHAGAFYHLVETVPLHEPHTLVLIDAHCDANDSADSDEIRSAIRKGPTVERRAGMLAEWRRSGKIQCYNWIEPLMPAPIAEVIWIPAARLSADQRAAMETDAREYLDAHQATRPRKAGALGPRYRVLSLEDFTREAASWPETKPVVASIDLDYFARTEDARLAAQMDGVMTVLLHMRALRGLSFAISSPYLRDATQAERLTTLALDAAWRIPNATVRFDPFATTGPDRSLMARLLERQGKRLPVFDVTQAGAELRSLLQQHWRHPRAEALLAEWARTPFQHRLSVTGKLKKPHGTWELEFDPEAALEVVPHPTGSRVRWWVVRAEGARYRISDANVGFATDAPRWIWRRPHLVAEGPVLSRLKLAELTGGADCGTFEIYAEVIRDGEITRTSQEIVRLSKPGTEGLHAEWSRQFGLPYVFDSRLLARASKTGAEACHGADCANFIIAALRADGWLLPWGSPADVKPFLKPGGAKDRPLLLHFGSHLAALWEDRPPVGELNDADLCVHQLEGVPEIIPYGSLRRNRAPPALMTIREPAEVIRIAVCGDLMLGRTMAEHPDPLAEVAPILQRADLALGNLECVIGTVMPKNHLQLIAPPRAVELLREAGLDGLGVANNHALDLGPGGLAATREALRGERLIPLGAEPHVFEVKGRRIAVLAVDDSVEEVVVSKPDVAADYVIVLPHWGTEHQTIPSLRQRELAVKLMQAGAHLVAGSGPHALQPLEHLHAGSVAFSLGNTVFDGPGPDAEWERGAVLEVTLDAQTCRPVRMQMIEVRADGRSRAGSPAAAR